MKRMLTLALALTLLMSLTWAVPVSAQESTDSIVIGIQQNSFIMDYKDNYMTHLLEEQLGINLEFYMLPSESTECNTKLSLMATSMEDLPGVLFVNGVKSQCDHFIHTFRTEYKKCR